ncbi:hypothetical protein DFH28DRAFT_1082598 [Melampsora americana]|nr:hypothetical protein DFH28DRAFT_1082598 [Melampsora americana]
MKLVFFFISFFNLISFITCFFKSSNLNRVYKRCQFVDDGFVRKDCGLAPTLEEFQEFLKKQAIQVANLAQSNLEPSKNPLLSDNVPVTASADGTLSRYGTVPIPAPMKVTKRDLEDQITNQSTHRSKRKIDEKASDRSLLKSRVVEPPSHSQFITRQVTSTSLLADNKPVTASADGTLSVNHIRSFLFEETHQMSSLEIRQVTTKSLLADNQPVTGLPDGTLAVYGSIPIAPPVKRDFNDEHELFERDDLIDEFLKEAILEKREDENLTKENRSINSGEDDEKLVLELIKRKEEVSEEELIVRNLPMRIGRDGKLYLFGSG